MTAPIPAGSPGQVRLSIPARAIGGCFVGEAWPTHRGRERTRKRKRSSIRRRTTANRKSNPTAPRKAH